MQTTRQFSPRTPTDNDFPVFDFGDPTAVNLFGDVGPNLGPGETIVESPAPSFTTSLYPFAASQPPSPAALSAVGFTIQDGPYAPASRVMTNIQPSGTADAEYLISCTVTTSAGRNITRSARILTTAL